jgi:hypothetical protein
VPLPGVPHPAGSSGGIRAWANQGIAVSARAHPASVVEHCKPPPGIHDNLARPVHPSPGIPPLTASSGVWLSTATQTKPTQDSRPASVVQRSLALHLHGHHSRRALRRTTGPGEVAVAPGAPPELRFRRGSQSVVRKIGVRPVSCANSSTPRILRLRQAGHRPTPAVTAPPAADTDGAWTLRSPQPDHGLSRPGYPSSSSSDRDAKFTAAFDRSRQ